MRFRFLSLFSLCSLSLVSVAQAQELQPPPPMGPPVKTGVSSNPPSNGPAPPPAEGETRRTLDEAEEKDSGRNFELFYVDGTIGGSYIDMRQFSEDTLKIEKASAGGPAFSLGAGLRFLVFVAGARIRHNALSSFNMWQINAEVGTKIPVSSFDLLFGLHGGYSFVGRLGDANQATATSTPAANDAVSIRGFNAGLDVAFDCYVSPMFSVGAGILGDLLFLKRPAVGLPANFGQLTPDQQAAIQNDPLYKQSGTSAGLQLAGGLRLGLHFGL
jgi:hypothetical protein